MNPNTFPLQPGMQGSAVADLQDALLLLSSHQLIRTFPALGRPTVEELQALAEGLKQERTQSTFGEATQQFIRYVQNQQGLGNQLAGIVEARTAAVLNKLLTDLGVLTSSPWFEVSGRVYSTERAVVGGLRATVVDKNVKGDAVLNSGITNAHGSYSIRNVAASLRKQQPDLQAEHLFVIRRVAMTHREKSSVT